MERLARLVVLVAAAAALACRGREAAVAPEAGAEAATPQEAGDEGDAAGEDGVSEAAPPVLVFAPLTGRIATVNAQIGDPVKKGDVLATIEPLDVVMPTTDLAKAQADFIAADHDLRRQKVLCEACNCGHDDEAAEDRYRKAKADLERARYRAQRGTDHERYSLASPVDGVVTAREAVPGSVVHGQYEADAGSKALFAVAPVAPP
jgi:multidrug resistance efflux pump